LAHHLPIQKDDKRTNPNHSNGGKKMKMNNFAKLVAILAIAGIVGFSATSFAGRGRGGGGCWNQGSGWEQRGAGPSCCQNNLSDEQMTRLQKERRAFFEETRDLRENMYQKELELRGELAKADPDAQKAGDLQAEISSLTAQLDQKRIAHRIKMKKENPELFAGRGYGKGGRGMDRGFYGHGKGRGPYGPGMGRGFQGRGGGCWY
jgi:Spy/CpxP family protein refolding chaperone